MLLLAMTIAFPALANGQSRFAFFEPVIPPRSTQVMVHRGMATAAPENSAAAIEKCIEDFCEWVEIDVRLSKDRQHVVIHNDTVDATTNGKGKVADLTLAELKELDAGSWFAPRFAGSRLLSLREALQIAKGRINLYLDCKQIDPKLLVEEVTAAGMTNQVVVFARPAVLAVVRTESQAAVAGMATYRPNTNVAEFIKEISPAAVEIHAENLTAELCQQFHAAGIKVQAQVLGAERDNPEVWRKVIDAGVDWLQTDQPGPLQFFSQHRRVARFPVMIACHRGANRYAPENTLQAIRAAAMLGVDFTEIDIRTTKDGKTILMHDGTVNRTTDGQGEVRNLTFDDVSALSAGKWFGAPFQQSRVPTFETGLTEFGRHMGAYLDAKSVEPGELISMIQKFQLAERHVVYQSLDYCQRLRQLDATVRVMPPLRRFEDLPAVAKTKPYAVDAAWSALSAELITECHRHGIQVFSDALGRNETVEQYTKAIGWGIDCIQTDHPLRVLRAIELIGNKNHGK